MGKIITNAREIALLALINIYKDSAWSEGALSKLLTEHKLSDRDSALASKLVYGVLQNMDLCDFYISAYSKTPTRKMDIYVLYALRLCVYQIVFLDKIPHNAAVNESVNLVKKYSKPHLTSFANGVLRQISRNADNLPVISTQTKEEYLALKYSHPLPLVKKLFDEYGRKTTEDILKANNETSLMTVRVNNLKTNVEYCKEQFEKLGISAREIEGFADSLELLNPGNITKLDMFADGFITVQDIASTLCVNALSPTKNAFMIDACAAPGGKSFYAAELMENEGTIISCDVHAHKIDILEEGKNRLSADIVNPTYLDATQTFDRFIDKADFCLCDVPCSGMGIIRKKPEIRFKSIEEIANLPQLQYNIICNISKYVKKGGILVYSTCTILKEENEEVVQKFLENHQEFEIIPFNLPKFGEISSGMKTLLQGVDGTDGFFMAKMRRKI